VQFATWNINGLRARLDFLLAWLKERSPDVVGLQELKLTDEQFPHAELEAAGYSALVHGQKSWNGVAVLSREPARATQVGLPGQADFGARLITAEVAGLSFTTLYCPNGKSLEHDDYRRKLAWYDDLDVHLRAKHRPESPTILCGDFNICPAAIDSWNGEAFAGQIFHTEEERSRIARLLDWGLVDVYRARNPETQAFSWWDYRGGAFHRKQGLRIDFVLAGASLMERVRSVEIDREWRKKKDGLTASDHAPVVVELDWPPSS